MKNKLYTFDEHLKKSLLDPAFRKEWEESEPEYRLACALIEERLKKKMSQRTLAKRIKTSQAAISRIEAMDGNPSFRLLKRIAHALEVKLHISFT